MVTRDVYANYHFTGHSAIAPARFQRFGLIRRCAGPAEPFEPPQNIFEVLHDTVHKGVLSVSENMHTFNSGVVEWLENHKIGNLFTVRY